jgi:hypothetical protein
MPIITGTLIYFFGFENYYLIFTILYLLLILLTLKRLFNKKTYIKDNLNFDVKFDPLFFFEGLWCETYSLLFFYIFLIFQNIIKWSLINSLLNLLLIVAVYFVSKFVDNRNDYNFGSLGYLTKAVLFSIILFSNDLFVVSLCILLFGLVYPIADIPYFGYFYYYIKTFGLNKIFEREVNITFGRGLLIILAFVDIKLALIIGLVSIIMFAYAYYFRTRKI